MGIGEDKVSSGVTMLTVGAIAVCVYCVNLIRDFPLRVVNNAACFLKMSDVIEK